MRRAGAVIIAVLTGCLATGKAQAVPRSDLVRSAGVKGGLIVHVGDDLETTCALRANESYVVQGLVRDAAEAARAREDLRKKGLLGPVTVIAWNGKRLPYADNMVNLLVVASGKWRVASGEVERVLAPRGVVMVSPKAGSASPKLPPLVTRHSPLEGGWKTFQKPVPTSIDEWTHFLHGSDNNAVAEDTQVEPPRYTQWVSGPRWGRSHDHLSGISGWYV